jgi:hypothetical protein
VINLFLSINKKNIAVIILSLFCFQNIEAQEMPNDFWSHVRYGGGIGLNFGSGFFSGTLAPSAIYQFDEKLALGLGLNFTYNSQENVYNSTILGGSLISLYNVIPQVQLSAEFEQLNVNRKFESNLNIVDDNYWIQALYLGVGYRSGNVAVGIRYDVLYDDERSIYADPWAPFVRFYF